MRKGLLLGLGVLLLIGAWGIARTIPVRVPVPPAYHRVLSQLEATASPAEICATVNTTFHVMLTVEDIAVFRYLKTTGTPADEALYWVTRYRQAASISKGRP